VILAEIRTVVAGGGEEVTLLGQNVTAYSWSGAGLDRAGLDFAGLLGQVARIPGLKRIRFLTGHPRDMNDALLRTIAAEPKICPALHLPMQSGSDRVLRRMKRLYKREKYLEVIQKARDWIPQVTFSSDFIVGFPGETEKDFLDTLEVVREVQYDQVFSFKYSERPGTPAANLTDDVPQEEKKRRLAELMAVQDEVWHRVAAAQRGQVWRGVIEGPARRPATAWRMRTANNRKVILPLEAATIGDEINARITGFVNTTFRGEPLTNSR
jgi:tRNA-2-methylthio-N6-dimethylallyladenosine synthase